MTVGSIAQALYKQYQLVNSQTYRQLAADLLRSSYGISNLSSALEMVKGAQKTSLYKTNLDQEVQTLFKLSQLPEYDMFDSIVSWNTDVLGSLEAIRNLASMGVAGSAREPATKDFDLSGILNPTTAAEMELKSAVVKQVSADRPLTLYQNYLAGYLSQGLIGRVINIAV